MSAAESRSAAAASRMQPAGDYHELVGRAPVMRRLYERIEHFACAPIPILLTGETGTGKEVVARTIAQIACNDRPFVPINCAALPQALIESELFGHEQGAFTGAVRRHAGLLARADGGVLFLDEIAEMTLSAQAKFLRALEAGEFSPLGSERVQRARFRLIAATNRDLDDLVERGRFRRDLLHRLGMARIAIPPLRDRLEDLPGLIDHFLHSVCRTSDRGPLTITRGALELCWSHSWPGNVRELKHLIEAAAALASGPHIEVEHLTEFLGGAANGDAPDMVLEDFPTLAELVRRTEIEAIRQALIRTRGDCSRAALLLGISVATLYRRLSGSGMGPQGPTPNPTA